MEAPNERTVFTKMKKFAVWALCAVLVFACIALPGCSGGKEEGGVTTLPGEGTSAVTELNAPKPDADPTGADTAASFDLNQYVLFVYAGTDGEGTVEAELKTAELAAALAPFLKSDNEDVKKLLAGGTTAEAIAEMSLNDIEYTVEPDHGLSNGDAVTLKWTVDEADLALSFSCKFLHEDFRQEVGGFAAKAD